MTGIRQDERPLRADARRSIESVIEAARELLADDPRADMQAIAQRAGVNRATVYRHFTSRDDLLHAVYLEYAERSTLAVERLDTATDQPREALRRATLELLDLADHWRPFRYAAPYPSEVDHHRTRMAERLIPLLECGQQAGDFRADLDALDLAIAWAMPFPFASIRMAEGQWSRERAADFILTLLSPGR